MSIRLIDAETLKLRIGELCINNDDLFSAKAYERIIGVIEAVPTIEPEVRHGRMIEGRYPNENKCSECGQVFRDDICFIYPYDENGVCKTPKRCPECGCYWDGGADNG